MKKGEAARWRGWVLKKIPEKKGGGSMVVSGREKILASIFFDTREQNGEISLMTLKTLTPLMTLKPSRLLKLIGFDVVGILAPTVGCFVCLHTLGGDINFAIWGVVIKHGIVTIS